jgi:muramoyltetrapeptide carboxypeptidase
VNRPRLPGPDAHIRIVSPSGPTLAFFPERARRAEHALRELGFRVSYGRHAFAASDDGVSAGSVRDRVDDIHEAFADPSVDAVLAADAGRTSAELVGALDLGVAAAHGKPFIGFCDNVFINHDLYRRAGLTSFYGCAFMTHFGEFGGVFPETARDFHQALVTTGPLSCRPARTRTNQWHDWVFEDAHPQTRRRDVAGGWDWLAGGRGSGPFLGGEISYVTRLARTDPAPFVGAVLFWDVAPANTAELRPQVARLAETIDLSRLGGMVVGADIRHSRDRWRDVVGRALSAIEPGIAYPVLVNADLGHVDPTWVVPYGETAVLDAVADALTFPRSAWAGG